MKNKTPLYFFGAALLVVFAAFSYTKFTEALTPYVSYEEAIATARSVQVAGGLEQGSSSYDTQKGSLHFTLVDPERGNKTMRVRYEGVKPANFEEAISIVAIGKWDTDAEEFAAHDLLVKCPSKYQGVEGYESKSYSASDMPQDYGSQPYGSGDAGGSGADHQEEPSEAVGPSI